jgi:hypothetical protein
MTDKGVAHFERIAHFPTTVCCACATPAPTAGTTIKHARAARMTTIGICIA